MTKYLHERKIVRLYVREGAKNNHYLALCVYQGGGDVWAGIGTVTVCCIYVQVSSVYTVS